MTGSVCGRLSIVLAFLVLACGHTSDSDDCRQFSHSTRACSCTCNMLGASTPSVTQWTDTSATA